MSLSIDTATKKEVFQLFLDDGWPESAIQLADEEYAIPTPQAIQQFGTRFGEFLYNSGLDAWVCEVWDCDDFALSAKSLSDIDHALWRKQTGATCALGFGIVWVETEQGGHAINVALGRDDAHRLVLRYYEPQMQEGAIWLQEKSRSYFVSPLWAYL